MEKITTPKYSKKAAGFLWTILGIPGPPKKNTKEKSLMEQIEEARAIIDLVSPPEATNDYGALSPIINKFVEQAGKMDGNSAPVNRKDNPLPRSERNIKDVPGKEVEDVPKISREEQFLMDLCAMADAGIRPEGVMDLIYGNIPTAQLDILLRHDDGVALLEGKCGDVARHREWFKEIFEIGREETGIAEENIDKKDVNDKGEEKIKLEGLENE